MKILLTAFEPFGGESRNAALEAMHLCRMQGHTVVTQVVPTVFADAARVVTEVLAREKCGAVICVGQAAGAKAIRVERVGINLADARIPDNAGAQPQDATLVQDGPAAYFSTLPTRTLVEALCAEGIPAECSYSAGTYVCNALFYGVLHYVAQNCPEVRVGFLHVPACEGMHPVFLPTCTVARALEIVLDVVEACGTEEAVI